jgi:hypothetical protein
MRADRFRHSICYAPESISLGSTISRHQISRLYRVRAKANIVVRIRPIVVQIERPNTRIRSIVPITTGNSAHIKILPVLHSYHDQRQSSHRSCVQVHQLAKTGLNIDALPVFYPFYRL